MTCEQGYRNGRAEVNNTISDRHERGVSRRAPEPRFPQSRGTLEPLQIPNVGAAHCQSTGTSDLPLQAVAHLLQSVPGPLFRRGQGTAILARKEVVGGLCFERRGINTYHSVGGMKVYSGLGILTFEFLGPLRAWSTISCPVLTTTQSGGSGTTVRDTGQTYNHRCTSSSVWAHVTISGPLVRPTFNAKPDEMETWKSRSFSATWATRNTSFALLEKLIRLEADGRDS